MHVPNQEYNNCMAFSSIKLQPLEKAIFETIFENFVDEPNFEKAISESMPDKKMITELELKIKDSEKELKQNRKELDKLVDLALTGTLAKDTIHSKKEELIKKSNIIKSQLKNDTDILNSLPDVNSIKQ
jgi:hypothetical protein